MIPGVGYVFEVVNLRSEIPCTDTTLASSTPVLHAESRPFR